MDELQISGKRFLSSRRAAKEHKYHADYIGQLVRGGKVAGQKVGRAWYVEADSLAAYFDKEESKGGSVRATPVLESVVVVEPVIEKSAVADVQEKIIVPIVKLETKEALPVEEKIVEVKEKEIEEVHRIPISTHARTTAGMHHAKKHTRLTYITDDEPVISIAESKKRFKTKAQINSEEVAETFAQIPTEQETVRLVPTPTWATKKSPLMQFGVVAMLGVGAFLLVASSSYFLTYNTVVDRGQMSATISLGAFNL